MKVYLISLFLLFTCSLTHAQKLSAKTLATADSLFAAKKYTESFELYQHLLEEQRTASPAMLLKMSFIKEGLGDYANALYYINLYYLQTADQKALDKMAEIAEAKDLQGYKSDDFDFAKTIFFKYFNYLIIILAALALLFASIMVYQKKNSIRPVVPSIMTLIMLALLFYTLNFGREYHKAIIAQNDTYIMSGPSAGSDVLEITKKGHRLSVIGETDIWTLIEWQGQRAYIKSDKLKMVKFI